MRRSVAPIAHTAEYVTKNLNIPLLKLADMLQQHRGGVVAITGAGGFLSTS